jgi:hypothetical protein
MYDRSEMKHIYVTASCLCTPAILQDTPRLHMCARQMVVHNGNHSSWIAPYITMQYVIMYLHIAQKYRDPAVEAPPWKLTHSQTMLLHDCIMCP